MRSIAVQGVLGLSGLLVLISTPSFSAEKKAAVAGKTISDIRDDAKLWSAGVVKSAKRDLVGIERAYQLPTVIRTIESLNGEPIREVAVRMARESGGEGIFILISGENSRIATRFSRSIAKRLEKIGPEQISQCFDLKPLLRQLDLDGDLTNCVQFIETMLSEARDREDEIAETTSEANERRKKRPTVEVLGSADTPRSIEYALVREENERLLGQFDEPERTESPQAKEKSPDKAADPLILRNQVRLTLGGARKIIAAAEAKALELKLKINIAVVDDGGHMLAFERMDGARPASGYTATTKAVSAATFRQATGPLPAGTTSPDPLLNLSLQNAAAASGGKVTTLFGGVPVVVDGQVIGGVGIGGGTGEQDATIARAGIEALLKELEPKK